MKKKKNALWMIMGVVLTLTVFSLAGCGGGGGGGGGTPCGSPTVDVTGTWLITETSTSNNCGDTIAVPYNMTFTQTGNSLSAYVPSSNLSFSGQICGNTVNWSGSYPEDGGTTTIDSLSATVSSGGNSFSGADSWHWTNGVSTCSGTTQFTGTRQSGGTSTPAAPSALSATATSSSSVTLSWTDNSNNETGFKIERSTSSTAGFTQIFIAGTNVQVYTDNSVSAQTTYYYRVRAYNSAGDSVYSNTANATTQAPPATVPTAPSNLTATSASSSSINLTWTDNSGDETGFKIESRPSTTTGFTQIATVGAGVTSYASTGLSASTTYYYRVRAYNSAGDSGYSNTANATTQAPPATVPTAPSNLTATAASSSSINLTWTDNSGDETGFKVERSTSLTTGFTQIATVTAGVTNYASTGLTASTTYYYRVRAYNSAGDSGYSITASALTPAPPATVPAAPSNLTATAASNTSINLTWTDNSNNETGFKIESRPSTTTVFMQIATVGAGVTSYSNTGLTASTTYYYRVRAYNSVGDTGYSNTSGATTQALPTYTLTVNKTGSGAGDGIVTGTGINCGGGYSDCTETFTSVTSVTLTEGILGGATFGGWTGCDSTSGATCTVNMNDNKTVTATFNTQTLSTITLQTTANNCVEYNSLDSSAADTVYQNCYPIVGIYSWSNLGGGATQAFASAVKFNVSSLSGKTIDSAILKLEVRTNGVGSYPQGFKIAAISTSWSATTITWNVMESFYYYIASWLTYSHPTYSGKVYNIDLKSIVQNWANGTYLNYGLGVLSADYTSPGNVTSFDAYDFYVPTLTVTYH